jgi:hypothetical protein
MFIKEKDLFKNQNEETSDVKSITNTTALLGTRRSPLKTKHDTVHKREENSYSKTISVSQPQPLANYYLANDIFLTSVTSLTLMLATTYHKSCNHRS